MQFSISFKSKKAILTICYIILLSVHIYLYYSIYFDMYGFLRNKTKEKVMHYLIKQMGF